MTCAAEAGAATTLRISLWSGPRNVSTALMYSFAQRSDTRVVDEPLYAHYLRVSGAAHPGREATLEAQDDDGERVVRDVVLGPCDRPVLFLKQMAQHLVGLDHGFTDRTANVLLVRDPRDVLPSFAVHVARPTLADTGLARQVQLLHALRGRGAAPAVLDARLLLRDPEGVLRRLCAHLGLAFEPAMLHWGAGPRPEDGPWAPFWYEGVHRSRGFAPYRSRSAPLPAHLSGVLAACRPLYDELLAEAERFLAA